MINACRLIRAQFNALRKIVDQIATLDCLSCFASVAVDSNYCKPIVLDLDKKREFIIKEGRHPVIEALLSDPYVPNSLDMKEDAQSAIVITGLNMGGKSSYIKQCAIIAIMAQMGCFVPAKSCRMSTFDAVYTRMGARDNISDGESTFMVELSEASDALHKCTVRSLIIMDELGRGTSTHDGAAIAWATLRFIVEHIKCFTLFVTHYPLIGKLEPRYKVSNTIQNFNMAFMAYDANENSQPDEQGEHHAKPTYVAIVFI